MSKAGKAGNKSGKGGKDVPSNKPSKHIINKYIRG